MSQNNQIRVYDNLELFFMICSCVIGIAMMINMKIYYSLLERFHFIGFITLGWLVLNGVVIHIDGWGWKSVSNWFCASLVCLYALSILWIGSFDNPDDLIGGSVLLAILGLAMMVYLLVEKIFCFMQCNWVILCFTLIALVADFLIGEYIAWTVFRVGVDSVNYHACIILIGTMIVTSMIALITTKKVIEN